MSDAYRSPPTKRQRMQQILDDAQQTFNIPDIHRVKQARNTLTKLRKYIAQHVAGGVQVLVWAETHPTVHAQLSERIRIASAEVLNTYIEHLNHSVRSLRKTEELKQDLASLTDKEVQGRVQSIQIKVLVVGAKTIPDTQTSDVASTSRDTVTSTPGVASTSHTTDATTPGVASTSLTTIASNNSPEEEGYRMFNVNNLSNIERTNGFLNDVRRYITDRLRNTRGALDVWMSTQPVTRSSKLTTPKRIESVERVEEFMRELEQELATLRRLETLQRELTALIANEVSIHIRHHMPTTQQQNSTSSAERTDTPPAHSTFDVVNIDDVALVRTLLSEVREHLAERLRTHQTQVVRVETYPSVDEQLAQPTVIERVEQIETYIQQVAARISYLSEIEQMYQDLSEMEEHPHLAEDSVSGCTIHVGDQNHQSQIPELTWVEVEAAFRTRITTGMIGNARSYYTDPRHFLDAVYPLFERRIEHELRRGAVKVNTSLHTEHRLPAHIQATVREMHFNTSNTIILASTDLRQWYERHVVEPIIAKMDICATRGSGWTLTLIQAMFININRYVGIHAGASTQLPQCIRNRKAVVNVQSDGNDCFPQAIMIGLCRQKATTNVHRIHTYPHYSTILNLEGIPMPMEMNNVAKFEQQNDLSVNIYALQYKNEETFVCIGDTDGESKRQFMPVPIYITQTPHADPPRHVNLLLMQYRYQSKKFHFSYITSLSRLLRSSLTRHDHGIHVCDRCLSYFHDKMKLQTHRRDCLLFNPVKSVLPSETNKYITFKEFAHKDTVPFIVYADIECALTPIETCTPSERESYTMKVNRHEPHSIAYYLHCSYNSKLSMFNLNCGEECIEWFVKQLLNIARRVGYIYKHIIPLTEMTAEQQREHQAANKCHICEQPFEDENNAKVRDHCHLQGTYIGAAHNNCNLNRKHVNFIPVVMHNLSGYDAHFLIKKLCETRIERSEEMEGYVDNPGGVQLLATNMEKYKGFTKQVPIHGSTWKQYMRLRFIDSFNFLHCSLDACARTLTSETMNVTRDHFPIPEHFALMRQKGVFPYEYITHIDVLKESSLPPREAFHSTLTGGGIAEAEYARAQQVWDTFECSTLREYSDLYLKADVLLLADIFENFRQGCRTTYGLDPAHYYTAPSLAWSALLKITGVTLELFTDIEMLQFVERGIRGGVVHCSFRQATANNKYMSDYNADKPSSYLLYFDVCNLYGYSMLQALPTGHFRWLSEDERNELNVQSVADDAQIGYILEVDLRYPQALHDHHRDYPLCPHTMHPPTTTSSSTHPKLLCTVMDKKRYVVHYRQLKVCVQEGLEIECIHRVLEFKQSAWMKPYIEINAEKRRQAKTLFERDLYKLLNNSVFGRTLMNVRKMRDVKLVTQWGGRYGAGRLLAKPNFKHRVVFAENCVAIEMARVSILFDKPIYVGMAILDISKAKMSNFHYQYMMKKYPEKNKLRMCYTDTDSFIYHVMTDDAYKDIQPDIPEWFDTGEFEEGNVYGISPQNGGIIGMMKDEMKGVILREFIGLRPKMYAIDTADAFACRAKGVRNSVSKHLTIDDYRTALKEQTNVLMRVQHCIRSERHIVYTICQNKIALSSLDDKRYILDDGIATLPWGHFAIPTLQVEDDVAENTTQ